MIRLTENIWIGGIHSWHNAPTLGIGGVLCVAQDARSHADCGWPDLEYMQVGLIDGPGNPPGAYVSAALALETLLGRHTQVLVFCHCGGRSLVTVLIRLCIDNDKPWDEMLALLNERSNLTLPAIHEVHLEALTNLVKNKERK